MMEEENAKVDMAGDEVKGKAREAAVDVILDIMDNLAWHANDPYLEIGDASSETH